MKTPRARRAGLLAGVLLVLAGCDRGTGGDGSSKEGGEAEKGGVAVFAETADITAPLSVVAGTVFEGNLASDVMNMELLRGDWQKDRMAYLTADESPMALARLYEYVGADSSDVRFRMRSDVKWSDGRPVTAHDVVFTYRLLANPALASARQSNVENLDSVAAQNDSTVTFFFARRFPEMISQTAVAPIPRHVYEGVDAAQIRSHPTLLDPARKLVVNGPFRIGEWRKGERLVLVPNPHFRPQPNLSQIVIRIIPDPMTRLVELQAGNVDFVQNVSFDQLPSVKAQPDIRIEREEKRYYDYIAYNPKGFPAFADPEIRRALGHAIDAPRLIQALQMSEYAVPASGPYSPIFPELNRATSPLAYNVDQARQILERKGWRDTDGDGIRERNGQPFRFTLHTNAGNQRRADAAQVVQQQWKQIGVDAQIQTLEFNTLFQNMQRHDYQAVLSGWGVQMSPDISNLFGPGEQYNITGYENPELAALFRSALQQPTHEAAAPYWKRAATILARDQPYTWLYFFDMVDGVRDRLRSMEIDSYGPWNNPWEWWIPKSQQGAAGGAPASTDTAK